MSELGQSKWIGMEGLKELADSGVSGVRLTTRDCITGRPQVTAQYCSTTVIYFSLVEHLHVLVFVSFIDVLHFPQICPFLGTYLYQCLYPCLHNPRRVSGQDFLFLKLHKCLPKLLACLIHFCIILI